MKRLALAFLAVALAAAGAAADQAEPLPVPSVSPFELIGQPAGPPLSGTELDRQTDDLASIMRCPVCQALSVNDSPSLSAIAMKEEIRDLLAAGYSREQVITYFEQAYGEFIRLEPRARGFNLVVWIAPALALLAGVVLVMARIGSRRRVEPVKPAGGESLDPYLDRVRREVDA